MISLTFSKIAGILKEAGCETVEHADNNEFQITYDSRSRLILETSCEDGQGFLTRSGTKTNQEVFIAARLKLKMQIPSNKTNRITTIKYASTRDARSAESIIRQACLNGKSTRDDCYMFPRDVSWILYASHHGTCTCFLRW